MLELIGNLYRLSKSNKEFFHTRFSLSEDSLESYKRIIQDAIHPYLEDNETLDIGRAEDAIERYSKGIDDLIGETELMIYFVVAHDVFIKYLFYRNVSSVRYYVFASLEKALFCAA